MPIYDFEGARPYIDPTAYVHPDAVVIGQVKIGPKCSIWPGVVIRGDVNRIIIGSETNIQDGSILHVNRPTPDNPDGTALIIGDRVLIGHNVTLHACRIDDEAMVGIGAIVMDHCHIGAAAMLGAGAMLTPRKQMEPGTLWLGSPARMVRERTREEMAATVATSTNYHALGQRYLTGKKVG